MLLYYFLHITGRWYEERLAKGSWLLLTVGGGITYIFKLAAGVLGTPGGYAATPYYLYYPYHVVMTVGTWLLAAGVVLYLLSLPWGLMYGHPLANREDPWGVSKFGLKDVVSPAFHPPHIRTPWPAVVGLATMPLALGLLNILAAMPTSVLSGAVSPSLSLGWGLVALFVALGLAWFKFDMVDRALAIRVMNGAHHLGIPKPPSGWGDLRVTMAWVKFSEAVLFLTFISPAYHGQACALPELERCAFTRTASFDASSYIPVEPRGDEPGRRRGRGGLPLEEVRGEGESPGGLWPAVSR